MGNCLSNEGGFEPPGSAAVKAYQQAREEQMNPVKRELVTLREHKRTSSDHTALKTPTKPKGPKCSVCFNHCTLTPNPWQATANARLVAEMSDDSDEEDDEDEDSAEGDRPRQPRPPRRLVLNGIQLESCKHVFCGACLAQAIFHALNIVFDPANYGLKLKDRRPAAAGRRPEFPVSCPECRGKPGEQPPEISDRVALLVLGPANLEEWNHARFLSTLNLIYCPHKGCDEQFDADDIAPAPSGVRHAATLVQCPRCRGSLCKSCKSVWHDKLTCEEYQALPLNERAPEDVAFANLARVEKWRRCPKCSAMVELKFGCNHITCVCKHHFCYQCGADFEHTNGKYRCTGGKGCKVWEEQNLLARD
ncbi:RBR-type E3 ubiquitin transferase [Mycena chlorophos]|uniref:RBR-type E3 ubiquitin transferase n=1 Tax=Mycena chlorophos TaxID=658473 RepID=A0A8H6TK82_MYCCL|nr:RBR-type E3 ubiquitin transferase [Mycena chlorophos]